jgi:hypothetical protein
VPSESFITTIGTAPLSSTTAAVSTPSSLTVATLNLVSSRRRALFAGIRRNYSDAIEALLEGAVPGRLSDLQRSKDPLLGHGEEQPEIEVAMVYQSHAGGAERPGAKCVLQGQNAYSAATTPTLGFSYVRLSEA